MRNTLFTSFLYLAAGCALHASVITLDPATGDTQGIAGSDVGWGFKMKQDPLFFISVITSGLTGQSNPALGSYNDFIGAEGGPVNGVLAPGTGIWTQEFDDVSWGVGAFTIDPGAPVGASDSGNIEIQFATYSGDPNTCGTCTLGIRTVDMPFSVTVVDTAPTPEPSSAWLLVAGCGCIGLRRALTAR